MQNLSIDYGHNSVKGASDKENIIFPSITSTDTKDMEITEFTDYKPVDFMRIKHDGNEYFVGDLARRQSDLCIQHVNDDDLTTYETKLLILTAAAYLSNDKEINIATDLPVSHHSELKNKVKQMLMSYNYPVVIDFYDWINQRYKTKAFYINQVEVQPQGFYSLMNILLDDNGQLIPDKKDIAVALNIIVDIGYYSTDILAINQLETIKLNNAVAIPGMVSAYRLLQQIIYDEFGIRKELHKIEPHFRFKRVKIGGRAYDITNAINNVISRVTAKITAEINNIIPFWAEVDNWLFCGGGSIPLYNDLTQHYQNIRRIPDPQMSNAIGGLKWARRKFNEK
ncbi:ParM/StbA family protein [Halocella sp. SP3-1]|uniref:ParM/StbA family protein n=1 Tax=Halocella sp. SP3-1 TaxID=2382161 RepID=UPI000F76216E|nr:ParM/StbA family protein [Halocella sp. SP3-1]AZO96110.1 ParM/StbA family protein [Halocella sp. SP3-1]